MKNIWFQASPLISDKLNQGIMLLKKIISGGQTGVDRGALDAALAVSFPCGGWCPAGRKAEDGPIPAKYPVEELFGAGYEQRTRRNVLDSDGTLILYFEELSGRTLKTFRYCEHLRKPVLKVNVAETTVDQAATQVADFVRREQIGCLNVAGPRESRAPEVSQIANEIISLVLYDRVSEMRFG